MRTSSLYVLVTLAVGMNASPTVMKRVDATPALQAREPAFSVNIPNNIPVSGTFRNGIAVTPKAGSGSIVTSNRNSTFFGGLFGRDDASPTLEAREPAFSINIPNNIPVSGTFRNGITVTPKAGSGSTVTGNNNSTLFGQLRSNFPFGFKRDDASPTLEAREPAFSVNIPNNIPVSGTFRNGITVTPKAGSGSIVTSNRNSTFFGGLFGREEATPALAAREPAFSVNIPNNIPVSGAFRNGLTIAPKTPSGSIVTGNDNSTLFGQLFGGFKREDGTPTLEAREPAFSVNIPNNIPVSGAFRNGLTITPKTPSGSIVTGNNNSTLFGQLGSVFPFGFKRDEE